jgi:ferredoxin
MSDQEKQVFLEKQKELQDALKNCPVPRIIIEEHNKAANQK